MPSITTWYRLHGRSRNETTDASINGRVSDPLWLLARQWQFGEFGGRDGGSPIVAQIETESALLNRFAIGAAAGGAAAVDYAPQKMPLEALVEGEPTFGGPATLGTAAEAGQHLLRLLGNTGNANAAVWKQAVLKAYPLAAPTGGGDPYVSTASERLMVGDDAILLRALYGRVPDGWAAFTALQSDPLACFPSATGADRDVLQALVGQWIAWFQRMGAEDPRNTSWATQRLEYQFSVAARFSDGEVVLSAPSYDGAGIDWHTFDVSASSTLGAQQSTTTATRALLPSPVGFRGMPASRCWEFEDGSLDVGIVDAGPTDLARLFVLDFALIYGNDWFLLPVDVPVGSLTRVSWLVVTDTFGATTLIPSVQDAVPTSEPWSMFHPGGLPGTLLMPPTTIQPMHGADLEEVLLLRDDGADVAWAVERVVETPSGRPFSREDEPLASSPARTPGSFVLASSVPSHWIPLIRTPSGSSPTSTGDVRLTRGIDLPANPGDATLSVGRLVTTQPPFAVYDEEVPREGFRVRRAYRYARWFDGTSVLWLFRTVSTGQGQGSSRLEYDEIL